MPNSDHQLNDARVEELLSSFDDARLLVVGDAFVDEYLYGDALRVSPEAPVPVVHVEDATTVLGGAGNVARNIVALGADCDFCCAVGDDDSGNRLDELLEELGVDSSGTVRVSGRPTTRKSRVIARRQQIVRVDRETREALPPEAAEQLLARVRAILERNDAALPTASSLVLEDYGKGLLSVEVGRTIMKAAGARGLPVNVDPKETLEPFPGASLIKPNLREAEALTGLRASGDGGLEAIGRRLQKLVGGGDVAITQGGDGMTIFEGSQHGVYVPTVRQEVFDVQGAGDTIIATLSLARGAGASLWEATVLAHAAAAVVVGKAGTATADRDEVRAALPAIRALAVEAST